MPSPRRDLLSVFADPAPGIVFRELVDPPDRGLVRPVRHTLGALLSPVARVELRRWVGAAGGSLGGIEAFYARHDGGSLCDLGGPDVAPLLSLLPVEAWEATTAAYRPGGELAWVVDVCSYRRARGLYRGDAPWVVFARIERGPGYLSMFLAGEDAGKVFFLAPEPHVNVARPVAPSFDRLGQRIARDAAAFLRLCDAHGSMGERVDAYVPDLGAFIFSPPP
jgi:hypothetical protein